MEEEGGSDFELELSDDDDRPKKKGKKAGAAAKVRIKCCFSLSKSGWLALANCWIAEGLSPLVAAA
jgi:hypothetical protein